MSHVIEHLLDPVGTLAIVRRLLMCGGVVVIATPNADSFLRSCLRSWWNPLDVPRHVLVFSPPSLATALATAGFVDVTVTTSSLAVERIAGDSCDAALAQRRLPKRLKWAMSRGAGVIAQGAAALIRSERRGVGDELRAWARSPMEPLVTAQS